MGWSFRKSFSLSKFIRLNVSKSGTSVSVGPKGAKVNFGKNGTHINVSVPGTGIRYREKLSSNAKEGEPSQSAINRAQAFLDDYDRQKEYEATIRRGSDEVPEMKDENIDPLFWDAAYFVVRSPIVGVSRIKYEFNLDYERADVIIKQLEVNGIVTPFNHGRKILVTEYAIDEMKRKYEQKVHQEQ